MTSRPDSFTAAAPDPVKLVCDSISDAAAQVKHQASDLCRSATERLDEARRAAASGLDTTASVLEDGGEKVNNLAHLAAEGVSSTAEYLKSHDTGRMMADVGQMIKKNLGISLVAAGVLGFLVGRSMRRVD